MDRRLRRLLFGPLWAGNLMCARFEGEGDGGGFDDGGGGGGDDAGPDWLHEDFELGDLAKDPDARKVLSKYKTAHEAIRSIPHREKQFRTSFRVPENLDGLKPEEVSKITGRLKGILKADHVRALVDAPAKPEDYELVRPKMPDGLTYDEQGEKNLRAWAVKHGISKAAVGELHDQLQAARIAAHTTETENVKKLWDETRKEMVERYKGEAEWERREKLAGQMLKEWGNKAGFKGDDIIASLLEVGTKEKLAPVLAAIAELATVAHAEGSTQIGALGGKGGENIDVDERWPASKSIMT